MDTTLLGIISGTAATAIYGVGAQINQYYMALSTSISGVFTPQINRIVARGEGTSSSRGCLRASGASSSCC